MQIRHILPADNLYAVYLLDHDPYAIYLKCQHRASVKRPVSDEPDAEWIDEIIGFVLDTNIVPADEVSEGTTFLYYLDRSEFTKEDWDQSYAHLKHWGLQVYQQTHPTPVPEVVQDIANKPQRRKRRARGSSTR